MDGHLEVVGPWSNASVGSRLLSGHDRSPRRKRIYAARNVRFLCNSVIVADLPFGRDAEYADLNLKPTERI